MQSAAAWQWVNVKQKLSLHFLPEPCRLHARIGFPVQYRQLNIAQVSALETHSGTLKFKVNVAHFLATGNFEAWEVLWRGDGLFVFTYK